MRAMTILRALTLAAALSAPLAQVALAQQVQQAMTSHSNQNAASAPAGITGPYDNLDSTAGN